MIASHMKLTSKIVHVVPAYPPSLGGMEQRVYELVNKLHAMQVAVEVFTSNLNTTLGTTCEEGIMVHRLRKIPFLQTPVSLTLFFRLLFVKVDIFHIHLAQPFFPIVGSIVSVLRRKPYIVHIRAIVESDNFFGKIFVYLYTKIALRFVLRHAHKIIALTHSYTDLLVEAYHIPPDRIVVIPNATEFTVVSVPKSPPTHRVKLLAVGRVDRQKNYFFMFRCLSLLKKQGCNFSLSIVGNGRLENELRNYAKELGINEEIIWRGRLQGQQLEDAYADADVFIHTAFFEGFATVLIEAMSKGLPICAASVMGVKDVVMHDFNGLLSVFNEEVFVSNLQRIITDKTLYRTFSEHNLHTVPMYKWSNILMATIGVYHSVISYEH